MVGPPMPQNLPSRRFTLNKPNNISKHGLNCFNVPVEHANPIGMKFSLIPLGEF